MDEKLRLGTEGYSPAVVRLAVRQAGNAASFRQASDDLRELARVAISPQHLAKLAERVGREWAAARDADVAAYRDRRLPCDYAQPPEAAVVMVDGGRVQTRQTGGGRGVTGPAWREVKVGCCQTLASPVHAADPQPEPPAKFLDRTHAAQLASELKSRAGAGPRRPKPPAPAKRRAKRRPPRARPLVTTVVASLADSETFGWQVAAEVQRRGLDRAARKAYVCDGQHYNWTLFALHLEPAGFVGVLDFVHLLGYLYGAAHAAGGTPATAWRRYERWLRWAWAGQVRQLLTGLRDAGRRLQRRAGPAGGEDPRCIVAEALTYVRNNRQRIDYPRYRRLGLPVSSAAVESTIKQVNRRLKGTEKFWCAGGAEAVLQIRAAYLSQDDRTARYWARPRPRSPAAGARRLRPAA